MSKTQIAPLGYAFALPLPLAAGTRLGRYEILAPVGAGGMGEVYRATDTKLKRFVALKLLPDAFAADPDRLARFQREAQVLASLNHPNIAAIYGVEDSNASHALVMELVEGATLADRLASGPMPLADALPIAKQIAAALDAAHGQGIVHRDLKPANIKVRDDGTVKVLDFGLAKLADPTASSPVNVTMSPTLSVHATMAGVILGTAAYMSPEQARGRAVDKRADIWAFGCVLAEMLTGQRLFLGDDLTEVLASVVKEQPDLSSAPQQVRRLLTRCLEKDPARRLRDIGDLWDLLDDAPATPQQMAVPSGRTWMPWSVAAVCALAAIAIAGVHFRETVAAPETTRLSLRLPSGATSTPSGALVVSPDGRTVVFAAIGSDGVQRFWRRALDTLEAAPIKDTEMATAAPPFWSPDSRHIAFWSGGKLKKVNVAGGPVEVICDAPRAVRGGSWTHDGVILFGNGPGILKVPATGGSPSPVTTPDGSSEHVYPWALPDGRHFLYLRRSTTPDNDGIFVGALDMAPGGQNSRRLLATTFGAIYAPAGNGDGHVVFARGGGIGGSRRSTALLAQRFDIRSLALIGEPVSIAEAVGTQYDFARFSVSSNDLLVYNATPNRNQRLTWFDRQGRVLGTPGDTAAYGTVKLSHDGNRVAVVEEDAAANQDIWIHDLVRGGKTRLTFNPAEEGQPTWSPDDRSIAFRSNRGGKWGIYRKPINGAGAEELLAETPGNPALTDWSRDGRFLLYFSAAQGTAQDLFVLPVDSPTSSRTPVPILRSKANESGGYFSPDSKWLAFISDETGTSEIYVQPFDPPGNPGGGSTSGKAIISNGGAGMARWRKDGRELLYLAPDGRVMSVALRLAPTFHADPAVPLFAIPLVFMRLSATPGAQADATSDNQRFLVEMPEQKDVEELTVVVNWSGMLKK